LASLYLIWGFFSPTRLFQDSDGRKLGIGGVLAFTDIAMYLFEHSRYCLFPSAWTATSFRTAANLLGGIGASLLVTAVWPRSAKILLIASILLLAVGDLSCCAVAHFDLHILSSFGWRFLRMDAGPLGAAITAALYLWRKWKEPERGSSEPPAESSEVPHAV
jgi:hypothetical protein